MTTIAWQTVAAAMDTIKPVTGGFTRVKRGIVTLPSGQKVFVKIAVDAETREWVGKEISAYHWLAKQGYNHAPEVLAEGDNSLALPDLSDYDWQPLWTPIKLNALLLALDDLVKLSPQAKNHFAGADFGPNPWLRIPQTTKAYNWAKGVIAPQEWEGLERLVKDKALRAEYKELAATQPWRGEDLVHYDARSDNFAFNTKTNLGLLVDWAWIGLGNKAFDQSAALINAYRLGFTDLSVYKDRLHKPSLAFLVGYWLVQVTETPKDVRSKTLRTHQIESLLAAHTIAQML